MLHEALQGLGMCLRTVLGQDSAVFSYMYFAFAKIACHFGLTVLAFGVGDYIFLRFVMGQWWLELQRSAGGGESWGGSLGT